MKERNAIGPSKTNGRSNAGPAEDIVVDDDAVANAAGVDNVVKLSRAGRPRRSRDRASGEYARTSVRAGDLSGRHNQNPAGLSLLELLAEDYRTHDRDPLQPGLWAVGVHRFGNWRMDVKTPLLRKPLSALYRGLYHAVTMASGIDVPYSTKLGRRVRFWHHGGTVISARAVGDDVCFRHNTTVGVSSRGAPVDAKPIIGNGVDVGVGAAILGDVVIGDGARIGANAVVVKDADAGATLVGVPARPLLRSGRR